MQRSSRPGGSRTPTTSSTRRPTWRAGPTSGASSHAQGSSASSCGYTASRAARPGGRAPCRRRRAAGVRGARGRLRPVVAERKCRTPLVEAYPAQGFSRRPEQLPPSAGYAPRRLQRVSQARGSRGRGARTLLQLRSSTAVIPPNAFYRRLLSATIQRCFILPLSKPSPPIAPPRPETTMSESSTSSLIDNWVDRRVLASRANFWTPRGQGAIAATAAQPSRGARWLDGAFATSAPTNLRCRIPMFR